MTDFSAGRSTHQGGRLAGPSLRVLTAFVAILLIAPASVAGASFGTWGPAVAESGINTSAAEGCPIESRTA